MNSESSMNSDNSQPGSSHASPSQRQPGDRFVAELDRLTRESYAHLEEADRMRRIGAIERRLAVLEYSLSQQERQQ